MAISQSSKAVQPGGDERIAAMKLCRASRATTPFGMSVYPQDCHACLTYIQLSPTPSQPIPHPAHDDQTRSICSYQHCLFSYPSDPFAMSLPIILALKPGHPHAASRARVLNNGRRLSAFSISTTEQRDLPRPN